MWSLICGRGESDAQPYIPDMVRRLKDEGYAHEDQGALVVDVKEESDTKEVPPCIILKSDGASLYATTDLATIVERVKLYNPDEILYLTDKRQEMHFHPGVPDSPESRDCRTGRKTAPSWLWNHEREGWKAL